MITSDDKQRTGQIVGFNDNDGGVVRDLATGQNYIFKYGDIQDALLTIIFHNKSLVRFKVYAIHTGSQTQMWAKLQLSSQPCMVYVVDFVKKRLVSSHF